MAFWNDPSNAILKQSFRWIISFENTNTGISTVLPSYFAKSIEKPSFKIDNNQAKMMYSYIHNIPKRVIWNPIKIEFYDIFEVGYEYNFNNNTHTYSSQKPNESNGLSEVLSSDNKKYKLSTNSFFQNLLKNSQYSYNDFSKYTFKNNLINAFLGKRFDAAEASNITKNIVYINELDNLGSIVECWNLYNPIIVSVDTSKLNYESSDVGIITVGISYDFATLDLTKNREGNINNGLTEVQIETKKRKI